MSIEWVLIVNRSRARLFHWLRDMTPPFMELGDLEYRDVRLSRPKQNSDRPGRFGLSGKPKSSCGSPEAAGTEGARVFAREIAEYLNRARQERRFDTVILIAEPIMLSELRKHLNSELRQPVAREFDNNLVDLDQLDWLQHLNELLTVEQPA